MMEKKTIVEAIIPVEDLRRMNHFPVNISLINIEQTCRQKFYLLKINKYQLRVYRIRKFDSVSLKLYASIASKIIYL